MPKPLVYIAGPYTHPDPVENTHNMCKFATMMVKEGIITPVVPHLSLIWHMADPQPYQFWLDYDLELLEHCDAMLRRPGASGGADGEEQFAGVAKIPVFHSITDLYVWAQNDWGQGIAFTNDPRFSMSPGDNDNRGGQYGIG